MVTYKGENKSHLPSSKHKIKKSTPTRLHIQTRRPFDPISFSCDQKSQEPHELEIFGCFIVCPSLFGWFILCLVYRAMLITLLDYADCPLRATSPTPSQKLVQGVKKTNKQKSKQLTGKTPNVW
jgi:hypothetical protein